MQAIQTKYIGPTETKGARIKAECFAGAITRPFLHDRSEEDAHRAVAYELAARLNWSRWLKFKNIVTGTLRNGSFVHAVKG